MSSKCRLCGAPVRPMPPDGDVRYDPPHEAERAALLRRIEEARWVKSMPVGSQVRGEFEAFRDSLSPTAAPPEGQEDAGRTIEAIMHPDNDPVGKAPEENQMTETQIKHMVDRFLAWKLPESFSPDAGISFKAAYNEHTAHPAKHEPTGTNLFDATQAEAMVRFMIEGLS